MSGVASASGPKVVAVWDASDVGDMGGVVGGVGDDVVAGVGMENSLRREGMLLLDG